MLIVSASRRRQARIHAAEAAFWTPVAGNASRFSDGYVNISWPRGGFRLVNSFIDELRPIDVELVADEPAVAARIDLLYSAILTGEVGHVGYCAARCNPAERAVMRWVYQRIGGLFARPTTEISILTACRQLFAQLDRPSTSKSSPPVCRTRRSAPPSVAVGNGDHASPDNAPNLRFVGASSFLPNLPTLCCGTAKGLWSFWQSDRPVCV
jgi:hypothetical protein